MGGWRCWWTMSRAPVDGKQVNFLLGQCLKLVPTADPVRLRAILVQKLENMTSSAEIDDFGVV